MLHHKIERVIKRTGFTPHGYNMRTLRYILESYPRDELFQISDSDLFSIALGVFHLQNRLRVALFVRRDTFGRFVSCLVYLPRDRMEIELTRRIEGILTKAFDGVVSAYYPLLGDEPLARLHFIIKTPYGTPEQASTSSPWNAGSRTPRAPGRIVWPSPYPPSSAARRARGWSGATPTPSRPRTARTSTRWWR